MQFFFISIHHHSSSFNATINQKFGYPKDHWRAIINDLYQVFETEIDPNSLKSNTFLNEPQTQ